MRSYGFILKNMRAACVVISVVILGCSLTRASEPGRAIQSPTPDSGCPIVIPVHPVEVAPGQPPVPDRSPTGIINALCDVTLNFVSCPFFPTTISITCDTNGDGVPELIIPLTDIAVVNPLLVRATLPRLIPQLPGTAFPLACCGGIAALTLSRTVGSGDDNVFGEFTQTLNCLIDLGTRAPVVISVTPSGGDCSLPQNLLISGSCFTLPDGTSNVTSVFAVEDGNPTNVITASRLVILNPNLIDAFFEFGSGNAGKTFLIFASGPNGTSRNLTSLPEGAPVDCPLGNEQGVQVSFTCSTEPGSQSPTSDLPVLTSCRVKRTKAGAFSLVLASSGIRSGSTITVGGIEPKKIKFKNPNSDGLFTRAVLKGSICSGLPGPIVVRDPEGVLSSPFFCNASCSE